MRNFQCGHEFIVDAIFCDATLMKELKPKLKAMRKELIL